MTAVFILNGWCVASVALGLWLGPRLKGVE